MVEVVSERTSFRARLLDLATEYEELHRSRDSLQIAYDSMLKEIHALRYRFPSTAERKVDQIFEPSPAPLCYQIINEMVVATRPTPTAPSFDAESCEHPVAVDASLFQLLGQEDVGNQTAESSTKKEDRGQKSQLVAMPDDCENASTNLSDSANVTKSPSTAESEPEESSSAIATRTGKRSAWKPGRSTLSAAQALQNAGYNLRRRSLVKLGLLDGCDADLAQRANGNDAELDDKLQSYWYRYSALDRHGKGISADALNDFAKALPLMSADKQRLTRFEYTIKEFNAYAVQTIDSNIECHDPLHLSFHVFIELMMMDDVAKACGPELAASIFEVRNMFIFEQATNVVSSLTSVPDEDIHANRAGPYIQLMYTDSVVSVVILLNACAVAVSTDVHPESSGWEVLEVFFVAFFLCELCVKMRIGGPRSYLFGDDRMWNWFDGFIILAAIIELFIFFCMEFDGWNIATLRLLRVLKVARVVRILRVPIFRELTLMVQGVIAGMRTLFWACALLIFVVFCLGMVLRQTIGSEISLECVNQERDSSHCSHIDVYRADLFSTVPRSMFTVLRCFTQGCESRDGTPLTLHLWEEYGWPIVLAYTICFLFVTFGLFNLIMAIFVENTMEAARFNEQKRESMRTFENIRVAKVLHKLMMRFCTVEADNDSQHPGLSGQLNLQVTTEHFMKIICQPETERLLDDLGIAVANPRDIFEVLDADSSGCVDLNELTTGFMKLRGPADKGDAVASLLKMDTVLRSVRAIESRLQSNLNAGVALKTRSEGED